MKMTNRYEEEIHIPSHTAQRDSVCFHKELLNVIDQFYYSIERVDLSNNTMCLLQCAAHTEAIGKVFSWTEYLQWSSEIFVGEQKKYVLENLSAEHLLEVYRTGETFYSIDASYLKDGILNSILCNVFFTSSDNVPLAYIMIRDSSKENLRKHIVDLYVHNSCDFLIYLDAKNNSYKMFSGAQNVANLRAKESDDYAGELVWYVKNFISPEDRKNAMREMSIPVVLAQLEEKGVHSFYCGYIDPIKGYKRKLFEYRYYESDAQMILFSCTDVTEVYKKEQLHRKALMEALKSAQTDMLTGLLNYKGTIEQISKALEENPEHAALLFIDIDNFKTVNDSLGHLMGDEVLCQIALILCDEAIDESLGDALIGRFGGDEFVIYFQNIKSIEDVKDYAGRVCRTVASMEYGKKADMPHISCSIGIVEAPKYGTDYTELLEKADAMAYHAKFTGKNKFVVYGDNLNQLNVHKEEIIK